MTEKNIAARFRGIVKLPQEEIERWKRNVKRSKRLSSKYEKEKQKKLEKRMRVLKL